MRKFSKKIAMMMVLAMLVSLFSGIVSASAASVWSFKSVDDDNYVAVPGATIEVKKGEFIDFDLFKADEEATKAGYEYTWESSDPEVLFINGAQGAKNGYARVKGDVGETASISATFTNLETGKSATRSFGVVVVEELKEAEEVEYKIAANFGDEAFVVGEEYELEAVVTADGKEVDADVVFSIDGKAIEGKYAPAKAGDVTIVATVVIKGEEYKAEYACTVVDAVATKIVSAKQVDAKKIELTFDAAISQAEAEKIELYLGDVAKNINKNKVTAKDNVVTFESYISFGNDKTWTFVYGDSKIDVKASQGEVAKVVITGPQIVYLNDNSKEITFKCYDANGVEVTKPADTYIEWKVDDTSAATIAGNIITFAAKDKGVTVTGIYHTYKYDETKNYEEITFTIDGFDIISLESNAATLTGVSKAGVALASGSASYDSLTVPAGKYDRKLFVQFAYSDGKTFATADELNATKQVITFESTDETKLIVDPYSGKLIPVAQGSAVVLILKDGEVFGKVTVVVGAAVASTAAAVDKPSQVMSNAVALAESVTYTFTGKDNYGADVAYSIKAMTKDNLITSPYKPDETAAIANVLNYLAINGNKLTVNSVVDGVALKTGTYVFEVKLSNPLDSKEDKIRVSVYVQDATDLEVKSYRIKLAANEFDTAITKDTKVADLAKTASFEIYAYNKSGVAIGKVTSGAEITIKLNGETVATNVYSIPLYVAGGAINGAYASQKTGTYVITGKVGSIDLPTASFVIKNSQAAPAVKVVEATAELAAKAVSGSAAFKAALETELAKCFKAPDNAGDGAYTFVAPVIKNAVSTMDENSAKGTYGAFVEKVTVVQNFAGGVSVSFDVDVKKNITVTLK